MIRKVASLYICWLRSKITKYKITCWAASFPALKLFVKTYNNHVGIPGHSEIISNEIADEKTSIAIKNNETL